MSWLILKHELQSSDVSFKYHIDEDVKSKSNTYR